MKGLAVFLLALVVLLMIVYTVRCIPLPFFGEAHGSLLVVDVKWLVDETPVTEAKDGDVVVVEVTLKALSDFKGYVEVKVRKDIKFFIDFTVASLKQYYVIKKGEQVKITLRFKAETGFMLRGYFVEVSWEHGKYVMDAEYPPRLKVVKS